MRYGGMWWALGALAVVAVLCAGHRSALTADGATPAKNPTALALQADDRTVIGWVSGTEAYRGREVCLRLGDAVETARVREDNTFSLRYTVEKPTTGVVSVGDLKQRITLAPPEQPGPCAYFVLERTAYRPGQTLHFAAFLREMTPGGSMDALPRRAVTAQLTSVRRGTKVAELALTSDAGGRLSGEYTFAESDPLDTYTLAIAGYRGQARCTLAEYRKSKIRLAMDGTARGTAVTVRFRALDFLEKAIPGSKVRYTAQVVRKEAPPAAHPFKEEQFAYYQPPQAALDPDRLSPEERLLCAAEPEYLPPAYRQPTVVVAQQEGDLALPEGAGECSVPVKAEWLDAQHAVLVQGVLIDANGHEQRASTEIALGGAGSLRLSLQQERLLAGETARVTLEEMPDLPDAAKITPTLVAMRLAPGAPGGLYDPYYYPISSVALPARFAWNDGPISQVLSPRSRAIAPWRRLPSPASGVQRVMVTAVPFSRGAAEVKLPDPGAYALVATAQLPDGTAVRGETYCLVQEPEELPALTLELDREHWQTGEHLTGTLRSRFSGARVLLTLRDSGGIRYCQPLTLHGTAAPLDLPLFPGLRYGCSLEAQYMEDGRVFLAQAFIRVVPEDKILRITAQVPAQVDAGERVKIPVSVNRAEPVDLIVTVYDKSLLGIAPDTAPDIRDYFLADTRLRATQDRDVLRRRLGGRTLGDLHAQLKAAARAEEDGEESSPQPAQLRQMLERWNNQHLISLPDLPALLALVHVDARFLQTMYGWTNLNVNGKGEQALADYLDQQRGNLSYRFTGDTLLIAGRQYSAHASFFRVGAMSELGMIDGLNFNGARARGDAFVSANAAFSDISGQAAFSQRALDQTVAPLEVDPETGVTIRRDFSDAACWKSALRTDDRGHATVDFKLPDSLTNWQVVVVAVSKDLAVGQHKATFTSTKPVMVWPFLPRAFTEGDTVQIFGSIHNRTERDQRIAVSCKVDNGTLLDAAKRTVEVPAGTSRPVYWRYVPEEPGFTEILMVADAPGGSDASLKRLPVLAAGVDEVVSAAGFVAAEVPFQAPPQVTLETARMEITLAPTLAADLADTLPYLVDYPYGCVEQTMSRFLPAIKVAQVLKRYDIENRELKDKLPKCVAQGIARLLELQQPDGGWGWYGNGQTHEMMTPYALYGLLEAEKAGYDIPNADAVTRGLDRLERFIDQMGEGQLADRLYCMSVYTHRRPMRDAWWTAIRQGLARAKLTDYAAALALEMAVSAGKRELADDLARYLDARADKHGLQSGARVSWRTGGFSRWGDNPNEVTAAVLKALVAYDAEHALIPGILAFFAQGKQGNHWTSTKDTAMIVYALCDYLAKERIVPGRTRALTVSVNGGAAQAVSFDQGLSQKIAVNAADLRAGKNVLAFSQASKGVMYRATLYYRTTAAELAPQEHGLRVRRTLYLLNDKGQRAHELAPGATVPRGAYLESAVTVTATTPGPLRYLQVRDPKLSGAELLPESDARYRASVSANLREDRVGFIAYHHEQGASGLTDRCVLHAELAGDFVIPPAAAELMYQPDVRGHSASFRLTVAEQEE